MDTMKAAMLKAFGSPLVIEDLADPVMGTGEVIVDVVATRMLAYSGEVFSGARRYILDLPIAPGAGGIARVRTIGPDATHLKVGDWVFCDPTVRSRDETLAPSILLQGVTAVDEGARKLHRHFHHGSFAEQMMVPTENARRIGAIDPAQAARWCAMGTLLVPYGGLLAARLQPGETLLVNGATGNFGSAGVSAALAMGVATVLATGRNQQALDALSRRYGARVRTVRMTGDEAVDRARILESAPGPIDCVLDLLPPAATPAQVRAAITTVRPNGRIALMGGVGMNGGPGVELSYSWIMRNNITIVGQWMYPPDAAIRMAGMIRAGLISLDDFEIAEFPLARVNEAVAHAAAHAGPFQMTVLRP
jgi:alcohol dehydrogenase